MVILMDVDGVCADFIGACLNFINDKHKTNYTNDDINQDIRKTLSHLWDDDCEKMIKSPGFCESLSIIPGCLEAYEYFRKTGYRIVFCTTPYRNAPHWPHERFLWLKKHFKIEREDLIFATDKRFVHGVALIDDKPSNVISWKQYHMHANNSGGTGVVFKQPWNLKDSLEIQKSHAVWSNDWTEISDNIQYIERWKR